MKRNIKNILFLMILSEALLTCFMGYWVYTQYLDERDSLKKDLAVEFDASQRNVSDSILLNKIIDPILSIGKLSSNIHIKVHLDTVTHNSNGRRTMQRDMEYTSVLSDSIPAERIIDSLSKNKLMAAGVRMMIMKLGDATDTMQRMFKNDTALFTKMFTDKMQRNGWKFRTRWVKPDNIPGTKKHPNIFIGNFIGNAYQMEVNLDPKFVLEKILPQILFTVILLCLTGFAFRIAYKSLKEQMRLSVMKNDLISNMSHELKTPVSTVKLALEALSNFNMIEDREKTKEYLEMATIEMARLDQLINQSLNNALLEEGKITFEIRKENLKTLTEEVLQTMRLRFSQNHTTATFHSEGNAFTGYVDRLHIQGVLINILDNSLKYGGDGVRIDVNVVEKETKVEITIADNGPGIPAAYADKIFDKFFRVPQNNEHSVKGYGLGLSYARHVMLQHNGSITATNLPEGGSKFTLTFNKVYA